MAESAGLCQSCYASIGKPCGNCIGAPIPSAYCGVSASIMLKLCNYRGCLVLLFLIGVPLLMAGFGLWDRNTLDSYRAMQCKYVATEYVYNSSCNDSVNAYDLNAYYVPDCSPLIATNLSEWSPNILIVQLDACVNQPNHSISENVTTDEYKYCWVDENCKNVLSLQPQSVSLLPALICICLGILCMLAWIWILCWKCGCLMHICQKIDKFALQESTRKYQQVSTV
mmetsp:Transcript_72290/g.115267  ORF Transcript_72290/g.115267 Transcript_72290/m.115267 type:complete len:226 (+) Transcript_72290:598-1275(+)